MRKFSNNVRKYRCRLCVPCASIQRKLFLFWLLNFLYVLCRLNFCVAVPSHKFTIRNTNYFWKRWNIFSRCRIAVTRWLRRSHRWMRVFVCARACLCVCEWLLTSVGALVCIGEWAPETETVKRCLCWLASVRLSARIFRIASFSVECVQSSCVQIDGGPSIECCYEFVFWIHTRNSIDLNLDILMIKFTLSRSMKSTKHWTISCSSFVLNKRTPHFAFHQQKRRWNVSALLIYRRTGCELCTSLVQVDESK